MSDTDTPTLPVRLRRKSDYRTIPELLTAVQTALDNALADPHLQSALMTYGYTLDRLSEGKRRYQAVLEHQREQQIRRGHQIATAAAYKTAWQQAYTSYARLLKVARVALKDQPGDLLMLGLKGERKRSFSGWKEQALQFYTNALAEARILARLQTFGVTEAKLREGLQQTQAAETAFAAQALNKGTAQQATASRNAALRELLRWHGDFITIARVALAEQPQQLEKLGIVAPSRS